MSEKDLCNTNKISWEKANIRNHISTGLEIARKYFCMQFVFFSWKVFKDCIMGHYLNRKEGTVKPFKKD